MARALGEYEIRGVRTTIPFFRGLLQDPEFRAGRCDTTFVDRLLERGGPPAPDRPADAELVAAIAVALHVSEGGAPPPRGGLEAGAVDPWGAQARAEALRSWPTP
jgi:acetyl/propionyl-CoA carboxylase alpha subunit